MTTWGTMYFLPWMRRGLAGSLSTEAVGGAPVTDVATVDVSVVIGDGTGGADLDPVTHTITLRGPGDVVGLVATEVVRTDPAPGTQDAEVNYFVSAELATADLPWMFTPAAADRDERLVPWLVLVVVRDTTANRIATTSTASLPVLSVADPAAELPNLDEAWAWAHVQCTADLATTAVADAYATAPEAFRARLLCPRRLDPDTAYIAAVVPAFDAGRRAGLGLPAVAPDPSTPGWWQAWTSDAAAAVDLPVLYSWTFRTGRDGDFEHLVRRLRPRELDAGLRDFDIGDAGTERLPPRPPATKLVSWKGALVSPAAREIRPDDAHRDRFGQAMRSIVNNGLGDGGEPEPGEAYDPLVHDPVMGPPAYGALAIGLDSVPEAIGHEQTAGRRHEPVWFGQANLDPVHRSVAGLGSEVVRRNQESLLAAAWNQAAALRQINRVLNWTRLAADIGQRQVESKLQGLSDAALLQATAAAAVRLRLDENVTAAGRLAATSLPARLTSAAFQRICRPEGPVGRARRGTAPAETNPATALTAACLTNLADALAYTSFVRPAGLHIGAETLMRGLPNSGDSGSSRERPAARSRARRVDAPALARRRVPLAGAAVAEMPSTVVAGAAWVTSTGRLVSRSVPVVGQDALAGAAAEVRSALRPRATLSAKLAERVSAPGDPFAGGTVPASLTATPEFPEPLYDKLRAIDPEYLLPGVGAIPDDTVGLTYVNAAFVEAFLLGANDELAREFVWREYPAPLDQTWLRTFWDSIPADGQDTASTVNDIGPVADWNAAPYSPRSALGDHQIGYGSQGTLVLVIKGALLRTYPDTVIYATKGVWNEERTDADGELVAANTIREEQVTSDGSPARRKNPLFVGALDHSTVFLGFDLDTAHALGPVDADGRPIPGGRHGDRDAGWFFVFEQAPAGPRFGLDIGNRGQAGGDVDRRPAHWRNVSWYHLVDDPADLPTLSHAEATGRMSGSAARPYDDVGLSNVNTFSETWGTDAAAMARITSQRPVRMLVHASAMLPGGTR